MTGPTHTAEQRMCVVGGHRHPGPGAACPDHVGELRALIDGVTRMTRQLGYHLLPSASSTAGEKVTTSRVGSPTPARLDVLSLIGPGVTELRRDRRSLVPQVRRWSTVETIDVHAVVDGQPTVQQRQVRVYHRELVVTHNPHAATCRCGQDHTSANGNRRGRPVQVLVDDQVGAVPPAEWLDVWVRRWRLALRHTGSTPILGQVDLACDADQRRRLHRAMIGEWVRVNSGRPAMLPAVAAFLAVRHDYEQFVADARTRVGHALLGVRHDGPDHQQRANDALLGVRPPAVTHDPATAEWIVRYGTAHTSALVEVDARYLSKWLPVAAETDDERVALDAFAAELRALHHELEHVLGETRDEQWVGRCPAQLVNPDGTTTTARRCGAGLWHDPHGRTPSIECPRCHTRWPETDWLPLAQLIRRTWPIDMRRRYTQTEREQATAAADQLPTCSGCDTTMTVEWKPAGWKGPARDRIPTWRPVRFACPNGCLAAGTLVAA